MKTKNPTLPQSYARGTKRGNHSLIALCAICLSFSPVAHASPPWIVPPPQITPETPPEKNVTDEGKTEGKVNVGAILSGQIKQKQSEDASIPPDDPYERAAWTMETMADVKDSSPGTQLKARIKLFLPAFSVMVKEAKNNPSPESVYGVLALAASDPKQDDPTVMGTVSRLARDFPDMFSVAAARLPPEASARITEAIQSRMSNFPNSVKKPKIEGITNTGQAPIPPQMPQPTQSMIGN